MDCKDFQAKIPLFLEDKLNRKEAKGFFTHMDECEVCKEELRIQYLVTEGSVRLEEGDSFDLNKELDVKIAQTAKKIKNRAIGNTILYILEAIGIVAVIFILILVFFGSMR